MWKGACRDEACRQVLSYSEYDCYVTCHNCGQTHSIASLDNIIPVNPSLESFASYLKNTIQKINVPPRAPDLVKVMGLSHYHEKLISPLLTSHGMDKHTGKATPLRLLTGRSTLDCSVFGNRCFRIDSRHLDTSGFGRDPSANAYLSETLGLLLPYNDNKPSLVPLHADGDGHCLVHAVSRALTGRELFWHPLRIGLKQHFITNIDMYKSLLGNFIHESEWPCIIEECEPDYKPPDGSMVGLRNIHVFGLANLLRRPIILLDSIAGMKMSADYAAVFLPGLNPPRACSSKTGQLNPPICLAWSSAARNHYIPLVPIKEYPLPKFPRSLLPKVWGFPQNLLDTYIKFDEQSCFYVGSEFSLPQPYILKLANAMDELFMSRHSVPPTIVTDLYIYHYSTKLITPPKQEHMIEVAAQMLQEQRLLRCLSCCGLCVVPISSHSLKPGGALYTAAKHLFGFFRDNYEYPFRNYGVTCVYDTRLDSLVVKSYSGNEPCNFCQDCYSLRSIRRDGSIAYVDGDITLVPLEQGNSAICPCGFKHYWGGEYYDNAPETCTIDISWNGKHVTDKVVWHQDESNARLNSKVFEVASNLVQKHFPDDADSMVVHQEIEEKLLAFSKALSKKRSRLSEAKGSRHSGSSPPSHKSPPSAPSASRTPEGKEGEAQEEQLPDRGEPFTNPQTEPSYDYPSKSGLKRSHMDSEEELCSRKKLSPSRTDPFDDLTHTHSELSNSPKPSTSRY